MAAKRINKELKHDALVELVHEELLYRGYENYTINKYQNYSSPNGCGEIDLYNIHHNYILLFEMKCSNTPKTTKKATEQLNRAEKNYFKIHAPNHRVFKLMAYYDSNAIDGWDCKWIK